MSEDRSWIDSISGVPRHKRILVLNSPKEKCGVGVYGRQLNDEFRALGLEVIESALLEHERLHETHCNDWVVVHMEPGLVDAQLDINLKRARSRGARIIMCCHRLDQAILSRFIDVVNLMVRHRPYGYEHERLIEIPLACPMYEPKDRIELRKQYELPEDAVIITTAGFLLPWKKIPETVHELLPYLDRNPKLFLQLLCTEHFSGEGASEVNRITSLLEGREGRYYFSTKFVPAEYILDRIHASDVGFVYHGQHTGSVSAATKQYISARCPLVVTNSTHSSDMRQGVVTTPLNIGSFVKKLVETATNADRLKFLKEDAEQEYNRINMNQVAKMYIKALSEIS